MYKRIKVSALILYSMSSQHEFATRKQSDCNTKDGDLSEDSFSEILDRFEDVSWEVIDRREAVVITTCRQQEVRLFSWLVVSHRATHRLDTTFQLIHSS